MQRTFTLDPGPWMIPLLIIATASMLHARPDQQILDREVTIELQDVPLSAALVEIEVVAGVKFVYSPSQLNLNTTVSIVAERKKLGLVLNDIFGPMAIHYSVDKRKEFILLKPAKADLERSSVEKKQIEAVRPYLAVTGTVTDGATQAPIAGVNIVVRGTTSGTTTDAEGQYTINANDSDILVFSFIGYKKFETQVGGRTRIDITMEQDVAALKEVVVNAGYYLTTDRHKTGNITRVEAEEIENQPVTSPLMALQGRVPGLDVVPNNGAPGSAAKIQIRGQNSVRWAGSNPLYVIDGVPIDTRPLTGYSKFNPVIDPFIAIDPANIEAIEVLKDADATAIYGSRGANGVILITTKKRTSRDHSNFNVGVYRGVGKITNKLDLLNTEQYIAMREEALREANLEPRAFDYDLNGTWDKTRYTDWQEVLLGGTADVTDLQFNVSGGSGKTTFNLGAGYHEEGLVYPGDFGYKRFTGRLKLIHESSDEKFHSAISISYGSNQSTLFNDLNLMNLIIDLAPNAPALYDENGELNWHPLPDGLSSWVNPLSLSRRTDELTNTSLLANVNVSYALHPKVRIKSNFGYTDTGGDQILKSPISGQDPNSPYISNVASCRFGINKRGSWIVEPQLIYEDQFQDHRLNVIVGTTFQESTSTYLNTLATGYSSDVLLGSLKGAANVQIVEDVDEKYRYSAVFTRIGYDFKNRYFLNLTARKDGSSRFGPGNQFGNFGAVGMAWLFSNESFSQANLPFLTFGKLRMSYGITGNDQIGDYKYFNTYSPTFYAYQGAVSLSPTQLFNPHLGWEVTKKLELAFESSFFDDRVAFDASWYKNRSTNQLVDIKVPATTGFPTVLSNFPALIENTGWEFRLSTINLRTPDFTWSSSLNYTAPRNKLVEFDDIENTSYAEIYQVGQPLEIRKYYTYIGVDPATGLHAVKDIDENGIFNNDDKTFMKPITRRFGGITNSLRYKTLELAFLFQFVLQDRARSDIFAYAPGSYRSNQSVNVLRRWQEEGDATDIQKFGASGDVRTAYARYSTSDATVVDASFIRLKTLSLSYLLPKSFLNRLHLGYTKIFIQVQNLLTLTDYEGLDPETGNTLPPLKMMTAGLQLHF